MKYDIATPYCASYLIFENQSEEIALLLRTGERWMSGYYTVPAGKLEHDEPYSTAAIREAEEEAGVKVDPTDLDLVHVSHRRQDGNDWVDLYFKVDKWSGEITNNEPDAHSELVWVHPRNFDQVKIIESQKGALKKIAKGILYSEFGWTS